MVESVVILILYTLLYGGLHSLLAANPVKERLRRLPGADRWYRLVYNIFATVTLLPLLWLMATLPDRLLYTVPPPWRWAMLAGQGLAALALVWSVLQANPAYFLGLAQLAGDATEQGDVLVTDGFYRLVRHPLYLFSILFLWLSPDMTVNRL
ncbi:MAG: isoprenylcysteine carboxylmethyltransferase family protein, partial [Caldilineae bacterium]